VKGVSDRRRRRRCATASESFVRMSSSTCARRYGASMKIPAASATPRSAASSSRRACFVRRQKTVEQKSVRVEARHRQGRCQRVGARHDVHDDTLHRSQGMTSRPSRIGEHRHAAVRDERDRLDRASALRRAPPAAAVFASVCSFTSMTLLCRCPAATAAGGQPAPPHRR
jgi:hypothetical protein